MAIATTDLTVANEIRNQLGGNRFAVMTGAHNFMGDANSLSFKLGRFAGVKINYVKIQLTAADDYTVTFGRIHGAKYSVLSTVEGVYCDTLRAVFESETGLHTSL